MRLPTTRSPIRVPRGERVLAWAATPEAAVVAGTSRALYLPALDAAPDTAPDTETAEPVRLPWEQVQAADWDAEEEALRVVAVGTWGQPRPEYRHALLEPGRLLQLVRERVTASIVWQRHVPVTERQGLRVIARRPPVPGGEIAWIFEYDEGVDPDDPLVRLAADDALAAARDELGV